MLRTTHVYRIIHEYSRIALQFRYSISSHSFVSIRCVCALFCVCISVLVSATTYGMAHHSHIFIYNMYIYYIAQPYNSYMSACLHASIHTYRICVYCIVYHVDIISISCLWVCARSREYIELSMIYISVAYRN